MGAYRVVLLVIISLMLCSPTRFIRDVDLSQMEPAELLKWAKSGLREAQFRLGVQYYTGFGQAKDSFEARRWLSLASRQGCSGADFYLDQMEYRSFPSLTEATSTGTDSLKAGYMETMRVLSADPLASVWGDSNSNLSVIRDMGELLKPAYNRDRWQDIRLGAMNVQKMVNAVRFQNCPQDYTLIIDKDSAYSFLVDNRSETIVSASPVNVGALHNNVTNYLSSGSGIHMIRAGVYFSYSWGSYGSGGLLIDNDRYINGSDAFIAIHGTNQESWLLASESPQDRYLTHGCVRLLDKTLKQYITLYRADKLKTAIYVPFTRPTGRVTQNAYTRRYFSRWANMRMGTEGPTLLDIINDLKARWRV